MNEKEKHFEGKVNQNAIVTTRGGSRVLIVRDVQDADLWELPGGRLNQGESPTDGIRRELLEELGVEVEVGRIYHTQYLWHERDQRENLLLMYEVFVPSEDINFNLESDELAEVKWVDKNSYKEIPMYKDTRESLDAYFNLQ